MKKTILFALIPILFLSALLCIPVLAQTNGFPPMPPIPVSITNAPPDLSAAIAQLINAIFPKFSVESIVGIVGAIFLLARTLRKLLPDRMQAGKIGQLLRHSALEVNPPTQETLLQNPTENAAPVAPPVMPPAPPKV